MRALRPLLVVFVLAFYSGLLMAQEDVTVYVTKTGSKYHTAGCSYLSKSSIAIKLSEIGSRYTPCSRCNPPTLASMKSKPDAASKKLDATSPNQVKTPATNTAKSKETEIGTTPTGKTLYQGPHGGVYHYSKSGKKVYQRKRK